MAYKLNLLSHFSFLNYEKLFSSTSLLLLLLLVLLSVVLVVPHGDGE